MPFRQAGQYEDSETGLYYNRFRYYDPALGTYLSKDPIGLEGGNPNLYGYVFDSNSEVDVLGLQKIRVYHYTSRSGYNAIIGSGTIKASDPGARSKGASRGKPNGVYVTTMNPTELSASGDRGKIGLTNEKSSHYVSFEVDSDKIRYIDPQDRKGRLYIQDDVQLRVDDKLRNDVTKGVSADYK